MWSVAYLLIFVGEKRDYMLIKHTERSGVELDFRFKHYYKYGSILMGTSCVLVPVIWEKAEEWKALIGRTYDSRGRLSKRIGRLISLGRVLKLQFPGNNQKAMRKRIIKQVQFAEKHPNPPKEPVKPKLTIMRKAKAPVIAIA